MYGTQCIKNKFDYKKPASIVIFMTMALFLFHLPIYGQQKTKSIPDSLTKSKIDTNDIYQRKAILDTIRPKPIQVTPSFDETYIDSIDSTDDLFENDDIIIPTPLDTTGKIRLPVSLKKDKYAYFDATQSIDRVVPNKAFQIGEELTFIIRYGPVVAGYSTMSIPKITKIKGNEVFNIVTEASSSGFFSAFYKVRDRVVSYMDRDGLFTWRFEKRLREGKYRSDRFVDYDQINGWAVTSKKDSMRIPPCVQDILTSFFYIRTQKLEVGKSLFIDNHSDNKLYPLEVIVHKKEKISVKAGEFDCFVVEPILRASGLFKSKGRLLIWLTDDTRKIPVQMKSKIVIGYITAELKEMKGIKK
jgi:hypothetical protein